MRRVLRVGRGVVPIAFFLGTLAILFGSPTPAKGDDALPTFAPVFTPSPSPSPTVTPLPPPISRPDDAHGIQQTTPPFGVRATLSAPPPQPSLWLSTANSFSVPCSLHAERIFVPVVVDGTPQTFLLDSSAPFSSIDPSAAPSHDVPVTLDTLQIGDLRFSSLTAGVTKIAAYARTNLGAAASGILGQELFARYPVRIDFRGCSLTIFRDGAAARASATDAANAVALRMMSGVPAVTGLLDGGVEALLLVNTASDADVDVTGTFAALNLRSLASVLPELRRVLPSGELSGETARGPSVTFGSVRVDRPLLGIITGGASFDGAAGFVGNGLLARFPLIFDEPESRLLLGSQAGALRQYDRSGVWLVALAGIVVKSVLAQSPAATAGLRAGDRIVAVNGEPIRDLDAARNLFAGPSGTALRVTYERAGQERATKLVLKTLI